MHRQRDRTLPASLVAGVGVTLFVAAVAHHAAELAALRWGPGPALAATLDMLPALALVYAGYWLSRSEFDVRNCRAVAASTLVGSAAFPTVMWTTIVVRRIKGQTIGEPAFPLLVAAGCGGVAGFAAGYYNARARPKAHQARIVADAFAFVNHFIGTGTRSGESPYWMGQLMIASEWESVNSQLRKVSPLSTQSRHNLSRDSFHVVRLTAVLIDTILTTPSPR